MVLVGLVDRRVVADAKQLPLFVVEQLEVHSAYFVIGALREGDELSGQQRRVRPGASKRRLELQRRRVELRRRLSSLTPHAFCLRERGEKSVGDHWNFFEAMRDRERDAMSGRCVFQREPGQ